MTKRTAALLVLVLGAVAVVALLIRPDPVEHMPPGPRYVPVPRIEGAYMDFAQREDVVREVVTLNPMTQLPLADVGAGPRDNPVTTGQFGLQGWSRFVVNRDRAGLADAVRAAEWLIEHQGQDGAWRYDFAYEADPRAPMIPAGWVSGMAQGHAMSLLVRLYDHVGDVRYLEAARAATKPLTVPIGEGGALGDLGGMWFEINPAGFHVLNAHMFTLIGLHDLAPYHRLAGELYEAGRATLEANLRLWDRGERPPLYDLRHQQLPVRRYQGDYDAEVEMLMLELNHHRPSPEIVRWMDRWFPSAT